VTTSTIDRSAEPAYAKPGPYAVGYTTLQLPDRAVVGEGARIESRFDHDDRTD